MGAAQCEDVLALHSPGHNNNLYSLVLEYFGGGNWELGTVNYPPKLNLNFETKGQAHMEKV